uniref:Uncharacterized protein n=1 Tax=Arundo donax TaxID=35708 RepID=A0A0A9DDC9_ARUDO
MQIMTLMTSKVARETGGTVKGPTWLSMTAPCSMNVDDICAVAVKKSTIDAQTGNIRSNIFSFSTWDTVQSLHGLICAAPLSSGNCATMAALSKNLNWLGCSILHFASVTSCREELSSGNTKL